MTRQEHSLGQGKVLHLNTCWGSPSMEQLCPSSLGFGLVHVRTL